MQSARNIPIPQRQHTTTRHQLYPCADLAPERYGNDVGPFTGTGVCNGILVEDDFFDLFGFDDLELEGVATPWPNFVPIQPSSQLPTTSPISPMFYISNNTLGHQSNFQNGLQGSGENWVASQLYPIHKDFRERQASHGSVFSAQSYSSITDQSSPRTFQSDNHSWTTYNTESFTQDAFHTEWDPDFGSSFSRGLPSFNSPDELAEIFGASHWPGLPHTADSLLLDMASYSHQAPAPVKARHPTNHVADNHSCDLDAEWGSAAGSLDLQDFTTAPKYSEWQGSTAELLGSENTTNSNLRQQSLWHSRNGCRPEVTQTWDFLAEESVIQIVDQPSSGIFPMPATVKPYLTQPQNCEQDYSKTKNGCQEVIWDCFVLEDGSGNTIAPPLPHHQGQKRERGRLPPNKRKVTADRRRQGTTCMRCRVAKVECDGHDPCQRCIRMGNNSSLSTPCIKASFSSIVKSGTCNYISQRNINHFTLDESRRIKMILPESFDLPQLLHMLDSRRNRFNMRARQASGSLYVLDLNQCYEFLKDLQNNCRSEKTNSLRTFIDETLVHTKSWFQCVTDCDPKNNKTLLLSQWNNMPSRATYSIIPHENSSEERSLDPEDEDDKRDILIAAQISRIVCRKLELDGYASLQAEINKMHTSSSSYSSRKATATRLGKILLTLRWRMSWWQLLGDGSNKDDIFRNRFVYRVEQLCKVLYFYYFTLKSRIGSWVGEEMSALRGEWSSYPDSSSVFDDFSTVNSIQGFE